MNKQHSVQFLHIVNLILETYVGRSVNNPTVSAVEIFFQTFCVRNNLPSLKRHEKNNFKKRLWWWTRLKIILALEMCMFLHIHYSSMVSTCTRRPCCPALKQMPVGFWHCIVLPEQGLRVSLSVFDLMESWNSFVQYPVWQLVKCNIVATNGDEYLHMYMKDIRLTIQRARRSKTCMLIKKKKHKALTA